MGEQWISVLLVVLFVALIISGLVTNRRRRQWQRRAADLPPADRDELGRQAAEAMRQRGLVSAVKLVRDRTGLGLADAKAAVERLHAGQPNWLDPPGAGPGDLDAGLRDEATDLKRWGKAVQAVALVRRRTGMSLVEAKRLVDRL
ncbi:hypothetical protein [Plantactinospora sp. GCM10030261]|uniref:hypothetical protein n=1 Tax=Plantactinospora sp. GCM10030261 TaxID=3273420 RepID=UPI00360AEE9D